MDFNSGVPDKLDDSLAWDAYSGSSISDSLGNFLFCSDGYYIYTKNGIIENGTGILQPGYAGSAIVKWPGQVGVYYFFTAVMPHTLDRGFYYSIVDMKANNGLGAVTEKNIWIEAGWDVSDRIATVKEDNSESVWVIVKKNIEDGIAAFLVDENGLHLNPVFSATPDRLPDPLCWAADGQIKISPDKKYLISQLGGSAEVCRFHAESGKVEYLYLLTGVIPSPDCGIDGLEFSPDSKFLYVACQKLPDPNEIYQFDMEFISDSALFKSSALLVGSGRATTMQLARDGKIYCTPGYDPPEINWRYISVIHKPWIRGEGCMFENVVLDMFPNRALALTFPQFLVDYLLRFEWTGERCQGYPIHFKPNFIPTPDSIVWHFGEMAPGSMTTELSPTYVFKYPGIHEVSVDIWYPTGRFEHTSREIEIFPRPQPDLGSDILICEGNSIILYANCAADFYTWNGIPGTSQYIISDSGYYRVSASFLETGCSGSDTIHIGFYPPILINETSLIITPTTCNGASGSITGLQTLGYPPYAYRWEDLSEVYFGSEIDVFSLPAGQYRLLISNGNGCVTVSNVYTIEDAGNLQVLDVQLIQPHCGRNDGQIIVSAFSPSGSALEYSINDGNDYSSDSLFSGLYAGTYIVRIRDVNGCEGFYLANPVILEDIPGPQVTQVNVTNETDFQGNGAIEIIASGSTPVLYYSIDGGATWQENDGGFYNLQSRIYSLQIWDENGCDTVFTVEIQNIILTYLHAITGPGGHCLGNTAMVPVNVDNFNSVATFHLKLSYNADNLQCEGFANVHPQLVDSLTGWVDQGAGEINLAWKSPTSVTFPGAEKVADLVFTTKNPGQGQLSWYTGETESYFTNSSGNPIPAEFQTGEVNIYDPPEIILDQSKTVCEGQFASLMSIAVGNQPPINYRWIYPAGDTTSNDPVFFNVTQSDAGLYTLLATDRVGCTDQKSIELMVSENPVAAFHGSDTLEMHTGDLLDAGTGLSSYRWNTGDSTESIVINAEGMYSVEMESPVGCLGSDSVYVKLTSEEIPEFDIYVPNAFSPNGDGINDIFQIKFPHSTFNLQHSTLSIFNRWGEEIFRSDDITQGWEGKKNGKDCPGGVYVYKIVFEVSGVQGNQERVGTVTLVR